MLSKINPISGRVSFLSLRHPRYLKSFFHLYQAYNNAQQIGKELENGLQVPPVLIISITPCCNFSL